MTVAERYGIDATASAHMSLYRELMARGTEGHR
jgi:hypothetical protein